MADKKTTVYHPALENVSQEVSAADVEAWVDAGWLKAPIKK